MKTQAVPALVISAPAISVPAASGPMMREAFMAMTFSASAEQHWARYHSGTMAADIIHAAAISLTHKLMSASSQLLHIMRNTGIFKGLPAESEA